jgi:hypothetical protein
MIMTSTVQLWQVLTLTPCFSELQVFLSEAVKDHNSSTSSDSSSSSSSCDTEPCLVPLMAAPLMDAADAQLLLQSAAGAASSYDKPGGAAAPLVHEVVAGHARARPDAACLVHDDKVFSYHEVTRMSKPYLKSLLEVTTCGCRACTCVCRWRMHAWI